MKENKTLKRMWKLIKPEIKSIIIISILATIISIIEILKPYLIKVAIDDYLSLGIYQNGIITISIIGGFYIALVIIGNIIDFIVKTATSMLGENVIYSLRNKLYKYIQYANITFHDKTPAGKLFVRITNDVEDISTLFKDVLTTLVKDILMIIAILSIMLVLDVKLALISFLIIPLIIIFSTYLTKLLNKKQEYSKSVKTRLNTFLAESIYGIKLIKIFNRQYEKQKECEQWTKKFWESRIPTGIIEGFLPGIMLILEKFGISIIVWTCVNQWFNVNLHVGVIYMFITYIQRLFDPINRLIDNFETLQESVVSIDKIFEILEQKDYLENLETGKILDNVKGKIEFKNVWFAYEKDNWILKNVSFTIEPGQSVALVGKTGSGKTTITNLINRFYEIQKGEILLDGVNIKEINIRSLRKNIGIILQDPFIFARSINDNVMLNENLSDEDVEEALQLSSAEDFINSLPAGIESVADERGNSYSAGQKQLLAFARIFAHNPSIFVLDEATANIDTHTEELIQRSIDKISSNKTSIFIAHRLSTIVNVDKIIVLNQGEIVEQGNHNELLSSGGYYSKLYQAYYNSLTA